MKKRVVLFIAAALTVVWMAGCHEEHVRRHDVVIVAPHGPPHGHGGPVGPWRPPHGGHRRH